MKELIEYLSNKEIKNKILDLIESTVVPKEWNKEEFRSLIGMQFEKIFIRLNNNYDSPSGGFKILNSKGFDLVWKQKSQRPIRVSVKSVKELLEKKRKITTCIAMKNTMGNNPQSDAYEWDVCLFIGRRYPESRGKIYFGAISSEVYSLIIKRATKDQIIAKIPVYKFGNTFCEREIRPVKSEQIKELSDFSQKIENYIDNGLAVINNKYINN